MKNKKNSIYYSNKNNNFSYLNAIDPSSRRKFLKFTGLGVAGLGLAPLRCTSSEQSEQDSVIPGFEAVSEERDPSLGWEPVSDRKIRVGLVGYGVCKFAAAFGFQDHPNVEVAAVSDLFPDRCAELAKVTRCETTYPSLEELVKDDSIEAVFVATDAPSHMRHCIEVLEHGMHVCTAVPAVFGSLKDADRLYEAVKKSGLKYMMMETSCFRADNWAMRQLYQAGILGKIVYAEGEYYHPQGLDSEGNPTSIGSYKNWRSNLPPQWYPTHSDAYYVGVTDQSFTEVSCLGVPGPWEDPNGQYGNPFGTEISMYRTSEGGIARMGRSHTLGDGGERGRIRGQMGSYYGEYEGPETNLPDLNRPPIPPGVPVGGHGGSHGRLMNEFVLSILEDRKPLVDVAKSLNMTVGGVVAHESALKDGEWMKIPQYEMWT